MTGISKDFSAAYNGWKNYPTWAVNLWLSNDEGLYNATLDLVQESYAEDPEHGAVYRTAGVLAAWVCDTLAPNLGATFAADLLGYALDLVDWNEIAAAWLECVPGD